MPVSTPTAAEEAIEMVDAIAEFATENGWKLDQRGCHNWAFGVFLRGEDKLQTHYAVDPETHDDKFILNGKMIEFDDLRKVIEADAVGSPSDTAMTGPDETTDDAVPPTSAAHSAAHQPTSPVVPPIGEEAVPPTGSAAHSPAAMPPTRPGSAAHPWDGAAHDVTADLADAAHLPARDPNLTAHLEAKATSEAYQDLDADERRSLGRELTGHARDAERQSTGEGDIVMNQTESQRAIMGQYVAEVNWSPEVSHLSSKEILRLVNGSEVVWRNRLSGSVEKATVSAKNKTNHPPRITPENFEPEDDDLRILHFLELGGGFRSVAVATIIQIA